MGFFRSDNSFCFLVALVWPRAWGLLVGNWHPVPVSMYSRERWVLPNATSTPPLQPSKCAKFDVGFTTVGFFQCLKIASFCTSQRLRVCAICRCPGEVAIMRPYCPLSVARVVPGTSKLFAHTLSSPTVRHKLIIKKKEIVM